MRVTKIFNWHCAHRLPSHPGLCKNIHGHSYKLEVEVEGNCNPDGMVIDFSDLKQIVNRQVVDMFDHAYVYDLNNEQERKIAKFLHDEIGQKLLPVDGPPTAELMAAWIFDIICSTVTFVETFRVRLWETNTSYAEVGK